MFTYEVFDDFVPLYHQNCIEKAVQQLDWEKNDNISSIPVIPNMPDGLKISESQSGMAANIFSFDGINNDILIGLCLPLIAKATDILGDKTKLERIRAGMFLRGNGLHKPHVDYFSKHYTLLYYVNDSDGDTYLFNEIATPGNTFHYPESFSLQDRISPKKGRAVIFNGLIYHSSSYPENHSSRMAININLLAES